MITPELFDTIELLVDIPERQLHAGMLGAIVDKYDDEHFEVEFANGAGKTEQLCALASDQFVGHKLTADSEHRLSGLSERNPFPVVRLRTDFALFESAQFVLEICCQV